MLVKQISVFVENTTGRLAKLMRVLADNQIDIIANSIADTTDFGILRCIVDQPEKAAEVLKANNFTASTTDVLAVELEDRPGGLQKVLEYLSEENVGVEYVYSFIHSRQNTALVLFKLDDPARGIEVLHKKGVNMLCHKDILRIKHES